MYSRSVFRAAVRTAIFTRSSRISPRSLGCSASVRKGNVLNLSVGRRNVVSPSVSAAFLSSSAAEPKEETEKREFQAETRMLLDIVAKSLYSEKEVFVRELISNASDALEKLRYLQLSGDSASDPQTPLEIRISTNKDARTITVQDTGLGMTKEELIDNLGTIARSGSKAFLKEIQESEGGAMDSIIGQFGVGFYSAFMVANQVEVFTRSHRPDSPGFRWTSDGSSNYEIQEMDGLDIGTKIIVHLKAGDGADYAEADKVEEIIRRYSNFVSSPIYLNDNRVNTIEALWTKDPKEISREQHEEFFKFITHSQDRPRYIIHYQTDAPVNIRALLYVPQQKPTLFDVAREGEVQVALYSRRVLIQSRANTLMPRYLRFLKGVVDSEDIPLNLSRELLQKTALLEKLKEVVASRVLRFLRDQMKKDMVKYEDFYRDFSLFMKEAIVSSHNQAEKEDVACLLLFESSNFRRGVKVSLNDYCDRLQGEQKDVYYLCVPSRELAETSPYFEAMKEKNLEVLFCYEAYDELVLLQLAQFDRKNLVSVEKFIQQDKSDTEKDTGPLSKREADKFLEWIQLTLGSKRVNQIKLSSRLTSYPCIVTVEEMGAARHFIRTQLSDLTQDQRYMLLKPTLEVNAKHPVMTGLNEMRHSDPELAELVVQQVYDNAMVAAGLLDDPRTMVTRLNNLMGKMMEKQITSRNTILRPS